MMYTAEMLRVSKLDRFPISKLPFFDDVNISAVYFILLFFYQIRIYLMIIPMTLLIVGTAEIVYYCVTLLVLNCSRFVYTREAEFRKI